MLHLHDFLSLYLSHSLPPPPLSLFPRFPATNLVPALTNLRASACAYWLMLHYEENIHFLKIHFV